MRALLIVAVLAGCHRVDPAYRREVEGVCESRFGHRGIRLRTGDGHALGRAVEAAPLEQRPFVLLRAARAVGLRTCGGAPVTLAAAVAALPSTPPELDGADAYDRFDPALPVVSALGPGDDRLTAGTQLVLDPDAPWAAVRTMLARADQPRILLAHGVDLASVAIAEARPPSDEELGLTVGVYPDAILIWSTSGQVGTAAAPRLRLAPGPDGRFAHAPLAAIVASAIDPDATRWYDRVAGLHRVRIVVDDRATMRTVGPVLAALRTSSPPGEPHELELLPAAPPPVPPATDDVRVARLIGDFRVPVTAADRAVIEAGLPALAACFAARVDRLAAGTLGLRITIDVDGNAALFLGAGSFGLADVDRCAAATVQTWRFGTRMPAIVVNLDLAMGIGEMR